MCIKTEVIKGTFKIGICLKKVYFSGDYEESRSPYLPELPKEQEQPGYQLIVQDVNQGSDSTTETRAVPAPIGQKNGWGQPIAQQGSKANHGPGGQHGPVPPPPPGDADRRDEKTCVEGGGRGTGGNTLPALREKGNLKIISPVGTGCM